MEVELSLDLINSCNYARKRQAALESCTEIIQSKIPALLVQGHSSSVSCVRCLRGEPGHINHLSS
ncbi:uncharacterized protein LOC144631215 isoform X1 [Oculina patagonica]